MSDLLEALGQGAEAWSRWWAEHPEAPWTLHDTVLTGRDLRGFDFRSMAFLRVQLTDADLSGALFTGGRLHDCDLRRAKVAGAQLGAWFGRSRLDEVDFTQADLHDADFSMASLEQTSFRGLDLSGMNFANADCAEADFSGANLTGASFERGRCYEAKFTGARLAGADFTNTILHFANFDDADLTGARFYTAQLTLASAQRANFTRANLGLASLVEGNLAGATLIDTRVYGLSAWNVNLDGARQDGLVITREDEPAITCDDVEIAQFIYLLLENANVRKVLDNVTSKVVLILGRFSEERKPVLDALREALRRLDTTPILFDFDKPSSKDVLGTVETLARLARFIIADITDPMSVPMELGVVVPNIPGTPVLPLLLEGHPEFSMFQDLRRRHPWVMETQHYRDQESLLAALPALIAPADALAAKLRGAT